MRVRIFAAMILAAFIFGITGTSFAQGETKVEKKSTVTKTQEKKPVMTKKEKTDSPKEEKVVKKEETKEVKSTGKTTHHKVARKHKVKKDLKKDEVK